MTENNFVVLRGQLASEPTLHELPNGTLILRLYLVVERESGPGYGAAAGKATPPADIIRVVRYGRKARDDYFYLRKDAQVVVFGWNQSRLYTDRRSGREVRRAQLEVNARTIVYGRGCNYERGDRQRAERQDEQRLSTEAPSSPAPSHWVDELLKALREDGE